MTSAQQMYKIGLGSMESLPQNNSPRCRICLQQQGQLIQLPCACIGEIGLVHQACFTKWVSTLRNQLYGFGIRNQNLQHINGNQYEIPCQICKSNIKIQMNQKRQCINCQQARKPEAIFALFCILFNLAIVGVVTYLCINSIVKQPINVVRIFINVFIMLIVYIILGWIIKKQITRLYHRKVTSLSIVKNNTNGNENDVCDFVIEQQAIKYTKNNNIQNKSQSSQSSSEKSSRKSRGSRRKRRQNNQN